MLDMIIPHYTGTNREDHDKSLNIIDWLKKIEKEYGTQPKA